MRVGEARELFRQITKEYFAGALVVFANQSRQPKPQIPLVLITAGNVSRPNSINHSDVDGTVVGNYLSRLSVTVDLFTHGKPVKDEDTGKVIAYEDTALEDVLSFADFLGSEYTVDWCHLKDLTILIDGDAQNLTGAVNDTNYEYRARLSLFVYFTQRTIDAAATASEKSILYPKKDGEYTSEEPIIQNSTTGHYGSEEEKAIEDAIVEKTFEPSSSGGGSQELTDKTVGYFTSAEIQEERNNG